MSTRIKVRERSLEVYATQVWTREDFPTMLEPLSGINGSPLGMVQVYGGAWSAVYPGYWIIEARANQRDFGYAIVSVLDDDLFRKRYVRCE